MKTKLFFVFIFGFIFGTVLESKKIISLYFLLTFLIIFLALFFWLKIRNVLVNDKLKLIIILIIFLLSTLFGSIRFELSEFLLRNLMLYQFDGEHVELVGKVKDDSYKKGGNTRFVIETKMISFNDKIIKISDEKIDIYTSSVGEFVYGDLVIIKGLLQKIKNKNGSDFDYESFSKKDSILFQIFNADVKVEKNIGNILTKKLKSIKSFFENKISYYLSEPHASLVTGMIIAGKKSMPQDIQEKFIKTGLIHIVVLSGFNVAIIISFLKSLLEGLKFNRKLSFIIIVFSLILFVMMVGFSPPVVRAVIMASIVLLGNVSYKNLDANKVLFFVAFLLCLWNPYSAPFDTSFQLSFLATFAIINLSPIFERYFMKIKNKILRETISQTLSAIVMVSPLILFLLGNLSLIALPVNILVLPIIPMLMLFGFLIPVFSFLPFIAFAISFVVFALSSYLFFIVNVSSKIPFAFFSIKGFPFYIVILFYIFILYFIKRYKISKV